MAIQSGRNTKIFANCLHRAAQLAEPLHAHPSSCGRLWTNVRTQCKSKRDTATAWQNMPRREDLRGRQKIAPLRSYTMKGCQTGFAVADSRYRLCTPPAMQAAPLGCPSIARAFRLASRLHFQQSRSSPGPRDGKSR